MTVPELRLPSPHQEISDELLSTHDVRLHLKRDDLIHPDFVGNKWRKLKYNIYVARNTNASTLLTFGGAYSNHIRAVAAAGYYIGFNTIGVIRGEQHTPLNPSLAYARRCGMSLTYMDRSTYRNKTDPEVLQSLRNQFGEFYLIPEGGTNYAGVCGCAEIVPEINQNFDAICCASGTGGTLAGVASSLASHQYAIGFAALQQSTFLYSNVTNLQIEAFGQATTNWTIEQNFTFGGYAKRTASLDTFIRYFKQRHNIQLDWVYEAKMMYGIYDLIEHGTVPKGSVIVALLAG